MATYPLRKVTRLADACFARWVQKDGTVVIQTITPAEYRAAQAGALPVNPTSDPQAVCGTAWSDAKYDTISGLLEPGCVVSWGEGIDWFNKDDPNELNPPRLAVGLESVSNAKGTAARVLYVPSKDVIGSADTPATLTVTNTQREPVSVTGGFLTTGVPAQA